MAKHSQTSIPEAQHRLTAPTAAIEASKTALERERRDGPCHLTNTAERGKFMPRSKHRRKPGGKAVAHPGRGKSRELPLSPEDVLWRRFVDGYTRPFHEKYEDSAASGAGDMLDLIEEGVSTQHKNVPWFPKVGMSPRCADDRGWRRRHQCPPAACVVGSSPEAAQRGAVGAGLEAATQAGDT